MTKIQDLEQKILGCWQITDDIDEVFQYFYETETIDKDVLAHILLGLKEIYNIKFENTFNLYEQALKEYYDSKPNSVSQRVL